MGNPVGPDVLPEDPENRALYRQHWQSIRTEETTGNHIQERYNFTLHDMTSSTFPEIVRYLYRQQTTAFKINLSYGFILRNIETGVLQYYHCSQNNAKLFDVPHLITNRRRLGAVFALVEPTRHPGVHPAAETQYQVGRSSADQRDLLPTQVDPTSHWCHSRPSRPYFEEQSCCCFFGGSHGPYTDNLYFFRCLAVQRGVPVTNVEVPTKTYYHQYLQYRQMASKDFQGVCLDDLMVLEQLFSLNVYVYDFQEMEK
jgi:hypothetical protein